MDDYFDNVFDAKASQQKNTEIVGNNRKRTIMRAKSSDSTVIDKECVESKADECVEMKVEVKANVKKYEKKEEKKESRVFGGGQTRLKWPPSEPIYGDCDRREGIDEARKHPDFYKSFEEYISEAELDFEKHEMTNRSGYVHNIFRINDPNIKTSKGVVFLQHGLFASADSWVVHKEKSLAI